MTGYQGKGRHQSTRLFIFCFGLLRFALGIGCAGFAAQLAAETHRYQASLHEADWQVESSVFECRLFQSIPGYGEAEFLHRAGEPLRFRVTGFADVIARDALVLKSEPPPWNYSREPVLLAASVEQSGVGGSATGVMLDTPLARKLIAEMLSGMVPTLSGFSNYDSEQAINVGLSPLRFKAAYDAYQLCASHLLPVNYDQVGRTTLFWPSGARQLSVEARQLLDSIVLYSKADASITGFEIDSFTDTAGDQRENLLLSEERAFMVTNYLISLGVDPESIATRAHGEREEFLVVNPERTAADRDRNRRVNVVMQRR